jgi:hypothetical protein
LLFFGTTKKLWREFERLKRGNCELFLLPSCGNFYILLLREKMLYNLCNMPTLLLQAIYDDGLTNRGKRPGYRSRINIFHSVSAALNIPLNMNSVFQSGVAIY